MANGPGHATTHTKMRAGGFLGKYLAYTVLTAAKSGRRVCVVSFCDRA